MIESSPHLKDAFSFLFQFLKNPMKKISQLPRFSYRDLILLQLSVSLFCGLVEGLISQSLFGTILYTVLMSVMTLALAFFTTGFFYFLFSIWLKIKIPQRSLFSIVIFALVPYLLFQIGANWVPPMNVLGFATFCLICTKGLSEIHNVPRRRVAQVTLSLFILYFIVWSFALWESSRALKSINKYYH